MIGANNSSVLLVLSMLLVNTANCLFFFSRFMSEYFQFFFHHSIIFRYPNFFTIFIDSETLSFRY